MPKKEKLKTFRIPVTVIGYTNGFVRVEAVNREQAHLLAQKRTDGPADWENSRGWNDTEVLEIDQVETEI